MTVVDLCGRAWSLLVTWSMNRCLRREQRGVTLTMHIMSIMKSDNIYDDELMTALDEQNRAKDDVLEDLFGVPEGKRGKLVVHSIGTLTSKRR